MPQLNGARATTTRQQQPAVWRPCKAVNRSIKALQHVKSFYRALTVIVHHMSNTYHRHTHTSLQCSAIINHQLTCDWDPQGVPRSSQFICHTTIVPSLAADAKTFPSGENASAHTSPFVVLESTSTRSLTMRPVSLDKDDDDDDSRGTSTSSPCCTSL